MGLVRPRRTKKTQDFLFHHLNLHILYYYLLHIIQLHTISIDRWWVFKPSKNFKNFCYRILINRKKKQVWESLKIFENVWKQLKLFEHIETTTFISYPKSHYHYLVDYILATPSAYITDPSSGSTLTLLPTWLYFSWHMVPVARGGSWRDSRCPIRWPSRGGRWLHPATARAYYHRHPSRPSVVRRLG